MPVNQQILDDQYLYITSNDSLVTVENGYVQNYAQSGNLTISMNWMPSNNSSISYYVIDNQIIRYSGTIGISESISSSLSISLNTSTKNEADSGNLCIA